MLLPSILISSGLIVSYLSKFCKPLMNIVATIFSLLILFSPMYFCFLLLKTAKFYILFELVFIS